MSNAAENNDVSYYELIIGYMNDLNGLTATDEKDYLAKWNKSSQALYELRTKDAAMEIVLSDEEKELVREAMKTMGSKKGEIDRLRTKYNRAESGAIGIDEEIPERFKLAEKNIKGVIEQMQASKFNQDKVKNLIIGFGQEKGKAIIPANHPVKVGMFKRYFERKWLLTKEEIDSLESKDNPAQIEVARLRELQKETMPSLMYSVAKYNIDTEKLEQEEG